MADASYVKSLCGGLDAPERKALDQSFTYVLGNLRFGAPQTPDETVTRATNFQAYWLNGTTSTTANQEFTIAHGLGYAPGVVIPVLALNQVGAQIVPLTVSRAPDDQRIYLKSSSTSAVFQIYCEF